MAGYSYPDKVLESFESQERVAGLISTPPSEPLQPGEVRSGGCEVPSLMSFSLALSFNASNVSLLHCSGKRDHFAEAVGAGSRNAGRWGDA
eukprot:COSAG02_NODE_58_length_43613_cov_235.901572_31_plen_91_part_00